jgi:transcriptional regulator of acetoin/glycerol metabolism
LEESRISDVRELREKIAQTMKADGRLRRLSAVIIDVNGSRPAHRQQEPRHISPASLSTRLAANARLIAITVRGFERLSRRLDRVSHVFSLLDADAVVLYSSGTTGMARREHHIPGTDWSRDYKGPSSAARAIAAGVPVAVIGDFDLEGTDVPSVRMACPVRLSDATIAGVLVLTIEVTRARPDHLLELSKLARRVCKFVENGPMDGTRKRSRAARIQPFAEAARNIAMVLSLPQIDSPTRVALSGLLADLENNGRSLLLGDTPSRGRRRRKERSQTHGAG